MTLQIVDEYGNGIRGVSVRGKGTNEGDTAIGAVADADARAGAVGLVIVSQLQGLNPSSTYDRLRTLAASGGGLGVLRTCPGYELLTTHSAVAIRDTNYAASAWLDMRGWRAFAFQVVNGLDQALVVNIQYSLQSSYANPDEWYDSGATTVGSGSQRLFSPSAHGARVTAIDNKLLLPPYMKFQLKASSAPTSGTATAYLYRIT